MAKSQASVKVRSQFFTILNNLRVAKVRFGRADSLQRIKMSIPALLPDPKFAIGEKVGEHWVDEFGKECVEIGVIVGICWHPKRYNWEYLINWLAGDGESAAYPCFDEHLVSDRLEGCTLTKIK